MVKSRRHLPFVVLIAIVVAVAVPVLFALAAAGASAQTTDPPPPPVPPKPPAPPVPPVPPVPTVPQLPKLPKVPNVPEVPKNPGELVDVVAPLSPRLMVNPRPHRGRALPARVQLDGWLMPPMRLDRVAGFFQKTFGIDLGVCGGHVRIVYQSAGRELASRRASLTRACAFRSEITIRSRRRLGPAGKLRATARFAGNSLLAPVQHSIVLRVI
jgi:hypothetical protein